jgi:hypothetical protein
MAHRMNLHVAGSPECRTRRDWHESRKSLKRLRAVARSARRPEHERTWQRSLARLADGYRRALGERAGAGARRVA